MSNILIHSVSTNYHGHSLTVFVIALSDIYEYVMSANMTMTIWKFQSDLHRRQLECGNKMQYLTSNIQYNIQLQCKSHIIIVG